MAKRGAGDGIDIELEDLPPEARWRTWMARIEAVLFASAAPAPRGRLACVVGRDVVLDVLIDALRADLADRPFEVVTVANGWMLRTRPAYGAVIRAAADRLRRAPA